MSTIQMEELAAGVPEVMSRVRAGEEFSIEENGVEVARISPAKIPVPRKRIIGLLNGQFKITENWKSIGMEDFEDYM